MLRGRNGLVIGVALLGVLLFQALPGPRPLDDAYITFRYARAINQGLGFVYNPGEQVQGTSTPLFTLLLAGLAFVLGPAAIPGISFALSLIADVLNTWLVYRLGRKLTGSELAAGGAAAVFLLQPFRLNVASGGMETSLFTFFLLAMYERFLVGRSLKGAAMFAALAILTRIDGVLAVGPLFLVALWRDWRSALRAAALAALLLLPWFAWATWYFGNPLPFSMIAKNAAYTEPYLVFNLVYMLNFLGTGTVGPYSQIWLALPGLLAWVVLAWPGLRRIRACLPEGLLLPAYPLLYYLVAALLGMPIFFIWYYPPLMPGLLILAFAGLAQLTPPRLRLLVGGFAAALLLLVPALLLYFSPGWAIQRLPEMDFQQACRQVQGQVRPGQVVFAPDIGVLGWCLEQAVILDPVGLVSPQSLAYFERRSPDEFISPQIVTELKPDYVIARRQFIRNLIDLPTFRQDYTLLWNSGDMAQQGDITLVYARK